GPSGRSAHHRRSLPWSRCGPGNRPPSASSRPCDGASESQAINAVEVHLVPLRAEGGLNLGDLLPNVGARIVGWEIEILGGGHAREGKAVRIVIEAPPGWADQGFPARAGATLEKPELPVLDRLIEHRDSTGHEQGFQIPVRRTLVLRINEHDAVSAKRLTGPAGGVAVGEDVGDAVGEEDVGGFSHDTLEVKGLGPGAFPALRLALDDIRFAAEVEADDVEGEGAGAAAGGINGPQVDPTGDGGERVPTEDDRGVDQGLGDEGLEGVLEFGEVSPAVALRIPASLPIQSLGGDGRIHL